MHRRPILLLVIVALVVAACTSTSTEVVDQPAAEPTPPRASILPPADTGDPEPEADDVPVPENTDDGRLVVQSASNQLSTMLPDGSDALPLTEEGTVNVQAAWAPDGSRVAWVEIDPATDTTSIALDRFDRSDYQTVEVENRPFYLYWDPSASKIASLSGSTGGVDLSIAEPFAEDGPTNRRIDRGQPFFMAWGPDGDELLVHASGFRLDRIDLGSSTIIVNEFPAQFGAPAWLPDDSLVYADTIDDEQFLVTAGSSGQGRRPLVTFPGRLRFAVSNAGNRVVMQAIPGDEEESVVTASFQTDPEPTPTPEFDESLDAINPIQPFIPYVMGTFGGDPFALSTQPAIALFPSPDGQSTAWFETAPGGRGAMVLRVDTGNTTYTTPAFVPSEEMVRSYFPFFDQYELSHDFWSPSSRLFVFAGRQLGDESDGIWTFDTETGDISRIADGIVASFTRTPTAAGAASSL
ncbi:MAG: hypothetical protein AAF567_13895 [Actinomycetota bacterium]